MSFFFRPKPELGIIFDIGSSSVGAALVRFDPNGHTHVAYTLREPVPYQQKVNPERLFKDMTRTLRHVNDLIIKEGFVHLRFTQSSTLRVKHVTYVFSSPWSATETKTIHIEKPEPFLFTQALTDRILDDEAKVFQKNIQGLSVIEKRITDVTLNGYSVFEPYGKKTKSADISLFVSLIPKVVLDKVSDASLSAYHPKNIKLFSLSLAAFSILRDTFHGVEDFIFLSVGGEVSDFFVVKAGLIIQTTSFPRGSHFIIRFVAERLSVTYTQAESLINMHTDGHGNESVQNSLSLVLEEASREWTKVFHEALVKTSNTVSLPSKLFVMIEGGLVRFFIESLKREKVVQFGVVDMSLDVTLISAETFRKIVSFGGHVRRDPSLALLAAFIGTKK